MAQKVQFVETVLRDANQSLIATRLPFEKFEPTPVPEMTEEPAPAEEVEAVEPTPEVTVEVPAA